MSRTIGGKLLFVVLWAIATGIGGAIAASASPHLLLLCSLWVALCQCAVLRLYVEDAWQWILPTACGGLFSAIVFSVGFFFFSLGISEYSLANLTFTTPAFFLLVFVSALPLTIAQCLAVNAYTHLSVDRNKLWIVACTIATVGGVAGFMYSMGQLDCSQLPRLLADRPNGCDIMLGGKVGFLYGLLQSPVMLPTLPD